MFSSSSLCCWITVAALAVGSPSTGIAQTDSDLPDAADAAAMFGYDAQTGALQFEGPPVLDGGVVQKQAALLTFDVRWRDAGRLVETVAADNLRLEAGALLFRTSFRASGLSSDVLPAWCGAGQGGLLRLKFTVCMVETPDGQARLADAYVVPTDIVGPVPQIFVSPAPDWYVAAIHTGDRTTPIARPRIDAVDADQLPPLQIKILYGGRSRDDLGLPIYIGLRSDPSSHRFMRQIILHTDGSGARIRLGRYDLVLTTSDQGLEEHWERAGLAPTVPPTAAQAGRPKPTPFVLDGALIDPQRLTVPTGVAHPGEDLAAGPVVHWATAKAVGAGSILFANFHTPLNAVFHKVETVTVDGLGARSISQAWCGPMTGLGVTGLFCAATDASGRIAGTAVHAGGVNWMAAPLPPSQQQATPIPLKQFDLTPSDQDLLGPMTFHLHLSDAGDQLIVKAQVQQQDDTTTVWRGSFPFGADGTARIPLWSHQLIATKAPGGLNVKLEPTGDGTGPLDGETAKGR